MREQFNFKQSMNSLIVIVVIQSSIANSDAMLVSKTNNNKQCRPQQIRRERASEWRV